VRFRRKAIAAWLLLILAIILGGFINARIGAAGVIVYGVVAFNLILYLGSRRARRQR
jgi:hypothetical protein